MRLLSLILLSATCFGQTAQVPPLAVTTKPAAASTPAPNPVAPVCIQLPKNGGKPCVTLVPANIPALQVQIPALSGTTAAAPIALPSNYTFQFTLTQQQIDEWNAAIENRGGSVTGVTITVKAAQP